MIGERCPDCSRVQDVQELIRRLASALRRHEPDCYLLAEVDRLIGKEVGER